MSRLILQIRKNHHFKITDKEGNEIRIKFLRKNGGTVDVAIEAPLDFKIDRFEEKLDVRNNGDD